MVIVTIIIIFSKIFYYSEDVKGYEFSVTDFRILVNVAFQSEIYTIHVKYRWLLSECLFFFLCQQIFLKTLFPQ